MLEVLSFLAALRDVHPDMARWGLNGGCFRVYLVLRQRFPDAEPWYDSNHVLTKIGDAFYDIRGQVEPVSDVGATYMLMDPLLFNRAYSWESSPMSAEQMRETILAPRVYGAAIKCLACGEVHPGLHGLPCPNMTPMAGGLAHG